MGGVLVVCEHLEGEFAEITFEMLSIAKTLDSSRVVALTFGSMGGLSSQLGASDKVVVASCADDFEPESYTASLQAAIAAESPDLILIGSTSMGMDLANPVAAKLGLPLVAYCTNITSSGSGFDCTSSLYGGKMEVSTELSGQSVVMMQVGAGDADSGRITASPEVAAISAPSAGGNIRFKGLVKPQAGDVDITQSEIIIAVGRGIGGKDDIEVAEELAELLGGDIACSRPLVDAGWLPKSRQIGKSGFKVKPKLYITLGISGAPEHVEGMKDSTTIVAINSDENAPIFDIAHYGIAEDLFDVVEELLEELE